MAHCPSNLVTTVIKIMMVVVVVKENVGQQSEFISTPLPVKNPTTSDPEKVKQHFRDVIFLNLTLKD